MLSLNRNVLKNSTVLLGLSIILMACGQPEKAPSEDADSPPISVMVTKGDPAALIQGATLNPQIPFTRQDFALIESYSLLNFTQFVEKEKDKINAADVSQLKKEQAPGDATTRATQAQNLFELKIEAQENSIFYIQMLGGKLGLKMTSGEAGHLKIIAVEAGGKSHSAKILHSSLTPDQRFWSLLIEGYDPDEGKVLLALYFEKTTRPLAISKSDEKFNYLSGPGVKIPWAPAAGKALNIDICGDRLSLATAHEVLDPWISILRNRINVKVQKVEKFGPFTDLNQHCIHVVDSYMYEVRKNVAVYGATISIQSLSKMEFIDSDIFMFREELAKFVKNEILKGASADEAQKVLIATFKKALGHEFGHMLGLDHKFDGTPSMMSYDFILETPSAYDIEALTALYPGQ